MIYSADGIPGVEALAVQKMLAILRSYKLNQEYSESKGENRTVMGAYVCPLLCR